MCLRSGEHRFYEGLIAFRLPLLYSGLANVWECATRQPTACIEGQGSNRVLDALFGYRGSFPVDEQPCSPDDIPRDVLPVREELRESSPRDHRSVTGQNIVSSCTTVGMLADLGLGLHGSTRTLRTGLGLIEPSSTAQTSSRSTPRRAARWATGITMRRRRRMHLRSRLRTSS